MSNGEPSDTMRGRVEENRYKIWLLTRMNRSAFAGAVSLVTFVALVVVTEIGPAPMRRVIESNDAMWWVFSPLITAIVTAVALVVTFNQLVLSQELGALGDQRNRMESATQFRADIEPWLDTEVAPQDPGSFLSAILRTVESIGEDLQASSNGEGGNGDDQVRQFVEAVTENARSVADGLEGARFGTFDVIFAALNFNYSWKIVEARRLLTEHGNEFDESTANCLEDLVTLFQFFGPAREHFKTLYFQWELVNLSRAMLYSSIPALVVAISMLLTVDPTAVSGAIIGIDAMVWLVCAAVVISLTPFFLLLSYVLRISTVAKRTLAMGPFVLRSRDHAT